MRIHRPVSSSERDVPRRAEIAQAMAGRGLDGRVCSQFCTIKCTHCGAISCQCMCSPTCPEMPRTISSDPERHPIEPAVAPLVFAMKQLALFQPCWSCEGHLGLDGTIWKIPRVWFYCGSVVAVRLLSDGLRSLEQAKKLHAPWQVTVTYSQADTAETTFSLQPTLPLDDAEKLPALQEDIASIANNLSALMKSQAHNLHRQTAGNAPQGR